MTWREAQVDIMRLWLTAECKTKEDLTKANEIFQKANFHECQEYLTTANKLILELANNQTSSQFEEVQLALFNALITG